MDIMEWPATPEQMSAQLLLEDIAKEQGNFDQRGVAGYVYLPDVRAYQVPLSMRWAMCLGPSGEVVIRVGDERDK